jgi:16S rRNA processing protein RimM
MTLGKGFPESLLLIGKVIRPHGLDGLLKISSYAESAETLANLKVVYLKGVSGEFVEHRVISIKPHNKSFLLNLEGLRAVEEAEQCRGAGIYVSKDCLGRGEGDYFWYELIGLKVYSLDGKYIGQIKHILPTGSNDIFIVGEGKGEVLIPATREVVKQIDTENQRMIISEMEGLLDLNEA